MNFIYNLSNLT